MSKTLTSDPCVELSFTVAPFSSFYFEHTQFCLMYAVLFAFFQNRSVT